MLAYRRLLADARFRRFWLAVLLVMVADEFVRTALVWNVYAVTGSAGAVGWLMVCLTGPIILGGVVAGWLLDRFARSLVMAADAAVRTVGLLGVALAVAFGVGGVLPYYVAAVIQGMLTMILLAGAPSAIAELIAPEQRSAANALEMLGFSAAGAVGPLLAGLCAAHVPPAVTLAAAALAYAGFGLVIRGMAIGGGGGRAAIARVKWRESGVFEPVVVIITVLFVIVNIGGGALAVFLPVLVDQGLGRGGETYGMLLAVMGVASSGGALLAGMVTSVARLPAMVAAAQTLMGLAALPIGLLFLAGAPPLGLVVLCLFVLGLVSGPLTVWAQTIRMRYVAPQWRGRAFATLRMIMQSGRPIGGALGGAAIAAVPLGACLIGVAAVMGVPPALSLLHRAMRRRLAGQ